MTIQGDGDFLYAPGVWWTAAHHRIPLLAVMHNNRAYHQEVMHLQRMANRHNRGITRAHIGTTIDDPNVDFAKIAQGMGVHAQGPITNPNDLAPAIKRALEVVKRGEPSLIDESEVQHDLLYGVGVLVSFVFWSARPAARADTCPAKIRRGPPGKRRGGEEAVRELWLLSVPRPRSAGIERDRPAPRGRARSHSRRSADTSGSQPVRCRRIHDPGRVGRTAQANLCG